MKLLLVLFSICTFSQAADVASIHNMIVFGKEKIYASHLPMYEHDVHRYQAIYEITFGEMADRDYREKSSEPTAKIFGISPQKRFTMPSLLKGSRFPAKLHPGHPEQSESIADVTVEVVRVVFFQPLKKEGGMRPKVVTYLKAGDGDLGCVFLAHLLTTPTLGFDTPADQFDQIVDLQQAVRPMTLEKFTIPDGATITLASADTFENRLTETKDSKHFVRGQVTTPQGTVEVMLRVQGETYLHTGGDVRVEGTPK